MNRVTTPLFSVLTLLTITGCGMAPQPVQLDGSYGGAFDSGGSWTGVVFAMDVTTDNEGVIRGDGALSDGYSYVYLTVKGTSTPSGSVRLTFTDANNDNLYIDSQRDGRMFRGSWSFPTGSTSGTVRYTDEDNIDNLAHQNLSLRNLPPINPNFGGTFQDLR